MNENNEDYINKQIRLMEPYMTRLIFDHPVPNMDPEDVRQELRIEVWEALKHFNPNTGVQFQTFAYKYMKNKAVSLYRSAIAKKRGSPNPDVVLDYTDDYDGIESGVSPMMRSVGFKEMYVPLQIHNILKEACSGDKKINQINAAIIAGYNAREISQHLGCTESYVRQCKQRLNEKIHKALDDDDIFG